MTTVYAVSRGSYSDYSVVAVFTDRALAVAHAKDIGGNEVEEYDLLEEAPHRITIHNISNHTYQGPREHQWTYLSWSYESHKRVEVSECTQNGALQLRVSGTNQRAVRKAYYDRLAEDAAQRAGIA